MREKLNFHIYFVLGMLGTGIDYTGYIYLNNLGMFYIISFVIAFLCGSTVSFFVHKKWTFEHKEGYKKQWKLYLFISFLFFLINMSATFTQVQFLHFNENWAKVISGLIFLWPNYFCVRKKVFIKNPVV